MLYRIHFYKGVDVNKTSASKECIFNFIVILYRFFVHFVFCIAILFLLKKKNLCKDWKAKKISVSVFVYEKRAI